MQRVEKKPVKCILDFSQTKHQFQKLNIKSWKLFNTSNKRNHKRKTN